MNRIALIGLCVVIGLSTARGQASREFDWIPSGTIAVGDEGSEADSGYRSDAPTPIRTELRYPSGRQVLATGRPAREETFRVRIATYRAGPIPAAMVIRRRWDTQQPAVTLKLKVEDKELPAWSIPKFAGERRWVDVLYAVPRKALQTPDGKQMRPEVSVAISSEAPVASHGYAFFMTRDWDILGEAHLGAVARKEGDDPKLAYLSGIAALGEADHTAALAAFAKAAADPPSELARLARRMMRLVKLREAADALKLQRTPEGFRAHYLLGLYASANGFWEEALDAFHKAATCEPTHADATYKLAEAMEYNRLPVAAYAPVLERAGTLYGRADTNTEDVLVAINTRAVKDMCGQLSLGSLEALYRDWRIVEQMVYGASRGAWKLRTTYRTWGPGSAEWIMHMGWLFGPPDSEVPIRGTYDYSVCTAEFGSSHAGGVDCGVSGSGAAQIGPTRGWEVLLHEWNHEFDWVCICGEQVPGYPVTHDSDGCGKQPIVNMGCGHRAAMHYYVTPAEYRRHEGADPELAGNHIAHWGLAELTPLAAEGDLAKWIAENKWMTPEQLDALKKEWEAARKKDKATPDWPQWLRPRWNAVKILDKVASPKEDALVRDPRAARWTKLESKTDFVDLLRAFPKAPEKCVVYAQTFIWSPKKQETRLWLAANPVLAVWLNGRKIHEGHYYACAKWDDASRTDMVANTARLEPGWNRLLCKIERGGRGWGFSAGLVTFDNAPVDGLKAQSSVPSKLVPLYQPPKVGVHYTWDAVRDDYIELLPALTEADLRGLTGIADLRSRSDLFFLGVGAAPKGARVLAEPKPDSRQLDNYLNWDSEAVAAIRCLRDGKPRDLLLIRPEYLDEYLELLHEPGGGLPGSGPKHRVLGTMFVQNPAYASTPNRFGRRYVLVVETFLGDYPLDEQDLLAVETQ